MAAERLQSFLFADLSSYSSLTEREGDEWAAEVAIQFASEAARLAGEHEAELVKRVGDAVMLRGEDAEEIVRLGLRLHSRFAEIPDFPAIHAGVHTGVAVERGGDWWGATVNVASRVASAAEAGELLITHATKAATGEIAGARLRGLGPRHFKNISSPIRLYSATQRAKVVNPSDSDRGRARSKRRGPRRGRLRLWPRLA